MPTETRVIALECEDTGWDYGILASTDQGIITNDTWWCSSELQDGWADVNFVANWNPAKEVALNGEEDFLLKISDIADEAMWIWTNDTSRKVYCRNVLGNILSLSYEVVLSKSFVFIMMEYYYFADRTCFDGIYTNTDL